MKSFGLVFSCAAVLLVSSLGHTSPFAVIVFNPESWRTHPPADWQVKVNRGRPEISGCQDGSGACVHLRSVKASFALEKGVDVDPYENRYLGWRWKVTDLPEGGDFRHAATDDQAAQVMVAFADRKVLTYIWDSTAPKGTMQTASSLPLVHIYAVVCESGKTESNRWVAELRDVATDYERAFGKPAPHVKGLRLQINSQHTGTTAESFRVRCRA